jgi:hypothetical protein
MGLGSGIRDPGSGKNLISDPGSRGQKGTGSRKFYLHKEFFLQFLRIVLKNFPRFYTFIETKIWCFNTKYSVSTIHNA